MEKRLSNVIYTRKCAVCNVIIWIVILVLIVAAVMTDSMSHYQQKKYDKVGIYRTDSDGYFECGWGEYSVQIEQDGDVIPIMSEAWHYGDAECNRLTYNQDDMCEWMSVPDNSGFIWCICNIIAGMIVLIGILIHFLSIFDNTLTSMLYNKRRIFRIIFVMSLMVSTSILFGIFYWFNMNTKHKGCWNDNYEYLLDEDTNSKTYGYHWYQFENKQLGTSFIWDSCALSISLIFVMLYCFLSCNCSNKSTRFVKDKVRLNIQNEKVMVEMLEGEGEGEKQ
eukprot:332307_1